jgi:flagellar biosynthesis chaperone FliJ
MKEFNKIQENFDALAPAVMDAVSPVLDGLHEKTRQLRELAETRNQFQNQLDELKETEAPALQAGVSVQAYTETLNKHIAGEEKKSFARKPVQSSLKVIDDAIADLIGKIKADEQALKGTAVSTMTAQAEAARKEFFLPLKSLLQKSAEFETEVYRIFKVIEESANEGRAGQNIVEPVEQVGRNFQARAGRLFYDRDLLYEIEKMIRKHTD